MWPWIRIMLIALCALEGARSFGRFHDQLPWIGVVFFALFVPFMLPAVTYGNRLVKRSYPWHPPSWYGDLLLRENHSERWDLIAWCLVALGAAGCITALLIHRFDWSFGPPEAAFPLVCGLGL